MEKRLLYSNINFFLKRRLIKLFENDINLKVIKGTKTRVN